jgi:hypothetical protein
MNYPTERKSPVRLTLENKWKIASFCIENRNVVNVDGEILFRVQATQTAKEINQANLVGTNITGYHVSDAIDTYKRICEMTKQMPFQTPQDSVREDQLIAQVARKEAEVKEWAQKVAEHAVKVNDLMNVLHKISQLIPVNVFGMKKLIAS